MAGGIFDDDEVTDWLVGFETDGVAAIEAALTTINEMDKDDFIEASDASFALAAAELVAAARDEDHGRLPKTIHASLESHRRRGRGRRMGRRPGGIARAAARLDAGGGTAVVYTTSVNPDFTA
jgi:hypothetical protein